MKFIMTGSTGFLGSIILNELSNHEIYTIGRNNCDFKFDLIKPNMGLFLPKVDTIIHIAGKAHIVPKTKHERQSFFDVNVTGTKNLLRLLEQNNLPNNFIFISSVAVYGFYKGNNIIESSPLKATDPYGKSKIEAENIISKWCQKHNITCTILRLPLLVGPEPPGNLGTMINGIKKGYYFNIGGGEAKKSMVLAKDVAQHLIKVSKIGGVYNLTDGYHPSFKELSESIANELDKTRILNIPYWFAQILALIGNLLGHRAPINMYKLKKITSELTFSDAKAKETFDWNPKGVLQETSWIQ